jgi:monoamine oxidase
LEAATSFCQASVRFASWHHEKRVGDAAIDGCARIFDDGRMADVDVAVIGAGAAGIAAARRLTGAGLSVRVLEARERVGGRAWTLRRDGLPLDLGCGWLHSAEKNEWASVARTLGLAIDETPPPWSRRAHQLNFSDAEQEDFADAWDRFDERVTAAAQQPRDRAAAECLEPGGRWNALLNALSTYINGVELERLSVQDFAHYHNTGVNWRVEIGYGALMQAHAAGLDIVLDCPATLIDHCGPEVRVETPHGALTARAAIVTVPTTLIASGELRFSPALPDKQEAAAALPLGLADKVFLRVEQPQLLPVQTRLFGATDRVETGSYHLRPFGAPMIEGYFGGEFARELEEAGKEAFAAFAIDQIAGLLGNDIRNRLTPIAVSRWHSDPYARGSYSYAKVGCSEQRAVLAAPVDDRLFFAGEACSINDYSTAHGAYRTGVRAAEEVLEILISSDCSDRPIS